MLGEFSNAMRDCMSTSVYTEDADDYYIYSIHRSLGYNLLDWINK